MKGRKRTKGYRENDNWENDVYFYEKSLVHSRGNLRMSERWSGEENHGYIWRMQTLFLAGYLSFEYNAALSHDNARVLELRKC